MGDLLIDLKQRTKAALKVLAPLGFIKDKEALGMVRHPGIGESFDISAMDPAEIVRVVFYRGRERGNNAARARMKAAHGAG
jgi:hypothetical protein